MFLVAATVAAIGAITLPGAVGQQQGAAVSVVRRSLGEGGSPPSVAGSPQRVRPVADKIASWVMEHTANGQQAEFFVVIAERADLRPAANLLTKTEKGRFVYRTLLEKARTTQGP